MFTKCFAKQKKEKKVERSSTHYSLLLVLTKLLDRIVARRHRRAWMIECVRRQSAAALRINLNVEGCGIVAVPVYDPCRAPLLLPCVH